MAGRQSTITCADFKYGVSRTFATDVITGGPNYALQFLDIPTHTQRRPSPGLPAARTRRWARPPYDKAVTCSGQTITFHLKKAVGDFNYTVSGALQEFAPFKAAQDKGAKSNFAVFS